MRCTVTGFAAGVCWLQWQSSLPQVALLWWIGGALALLVLCLHFAPRYFADWQFEALRFSPLRNSSISIPDGRGWRMIALAAAGVLAGILWSALFACHTLYRELPRELEGKDLTVIGVIDSLPGRFEQGVRFNFAVEQVMEGGRALERARLPARLALSWYATSGATQARVRPDQVVGLLPGERWQFTVRLRRPHGNANPFGFDYEAWLLEQNLRATGTVRTSPDNRRLAEFVPGFSNAIERSRGWLRDRIQTTLAGKEFAGVIVALVVGDQRDISQSDWKVFNRTGVGHLMSISGLHITMVAGLFAALMMALWRRSFFMGHSLPLMLPAQKAAALAGALAALAYVLLAGFAVPAQRTLYMLCVVAIALWVGRITSVSHVLCAALGLVLLLDPWAVLWPGFWLSFGAVGFILYASVGRIVVQEAQSDLRSPGSQNFPGWQNTPGADGVIGTQGARGWKAALAGATRTQYAVTLGLVPLSMLLFAQTSLVSPIANTMAIPLVSFMVTPLSLAGSVLPAPLSGWALHGAHLLLEWLAVMLRWMSDFPVAVWRAPVPPGWVFALAVAGTFWLLAPRGWPVRWLGLAAWVPLLINVPLRPESGLWVTAFDVGQGTALLVETPNHRLLYDTGPFYTPESDGGSRVILPYLRGRGITALDGIMVSHNDNDHSGGALSVMNEIRAGWVASSLAADSPIVKRAPVHRRCLAGQEWTWDGVLFEVLHPFATQYENEKARPNTLSCTLRITWGRHAILLPGDIEAPQEAELIRTSAGKLRADVLLAPHHGSGTSSTAPFLAAVQPEIALFQTGYLNRYKHPKKEVFDRYGDLGVRRLRTDESGALRLTIGDDIAVEEFRVTQARYWHGR